MTKYIFITGGVISSLGKGVAAASLGALLQVHGYNVRIRKLDPYLNVDPGTMSPFQHGEVFVTDDGVETDLDIGHYERFTGVKATKDDSYTSGKIYHHLIQKERRGDYLGKTVQVIPHVTDLIKQVVTYNINNDDFIICEVGGTVGDIEGLPFYDSIRQLKNNLGRDNVLYIHLTLVPYIATAGELKSKPTQHSVNTLRSIGIQPDIILCRADRSIPDDCLQKISLFADIEKNCVIPLLDQNSIYSVPVALHQQNLDNIILGKFGLQYNGKPDLRKWHEIAAKINNSQNKVNIGLIGKYNSLEDSYSSLNEALKHAGIASEAQVNIIFIDSREENFANIKKQIDKVDGIIVPGGFGIEGIEGKIMAIDYARKNNIPFLGICYGMQLAAVGIARDLLNIKDANSTEVTSNCTNVIDLITQSPAKNGLEPENKSQNLGATMRLGGYQCKLKKDSKIREIYGQDIITERHRHRYELNPNYFNALEKVGLKISGMSIDDKLAAIVEMPSHPWFIGVQFHPEFTSRPLEPNPLFCSFIKAAIGNSIKNFSVR